MASIKIIIIVKLISNNKKKDVTGNQVPKKLINKREVPLRIGQVSLTV